MKKLIFIIAALSAAAVLFAQDLSDDELFGGAEGDDALFADDGIEELEPVVEESDVISDLRKGVLFENDFVKVGGKFTTTLGTSTVVYKNEDKSFADHLKESTLTPTLSAFLTVDARPSQTLRMYTKFGLAYPFTNSVSTWWKLKEIFTDFSIADTAFFRFGIHTVTWGTGYFFSPVSDMINTTSIDPEDVTAQVDGCLNLRTQICFPNTQNCLWFYLIPSTDFINQTSAASYVEDTALAGKADLVFGGWEFGLGGYWKWQSAPKAMITASGSILNLNVFGEAVYSYGAASEWSDNTDYTGKTSIFQGTAGCSYYWKTPQITLAAQYYYDGNNKDNQYMTYGHNVAGIINFGKVFGSTNFSANIFGMVNFGKDAIPEKYETYFENYGISSYLNAATFSASISFSPINEITISAGPYATFKSFTELPVVYMKLNFTLGGGKF